MRCNSILSARARVNRRMANLVGDVWRSGVSPRTFGCRNDSAAVRDVGRPTPRRLPTESHVTMTGCIRSPPPSTTSKFSAAR